MHVEASGPGGTFEHQVKPPRPFSDAQFEPVCTLPCSAPVAGDGSYRISGSGVTDSGTFQVGDAKRVDVRVQPGSASANMLGRILFVGGSAVAVVTLSYLAGDFSQRDSNTGLPQLMSQDTSRTGFVVAGVAVAVAIAGLVVGLNSTTHVDVEHVADKGVALPGGAALKRSGAVSF